MAVIDDDAEMRLYLDGVLTSGGYACKLFEEAESALRWLATTKDLPALVLSDIGMPGISGLELLRTLRAVLPDLPVVLLSGSCDLASAESAVRGGAIEYLLKPAGPADVLAAVSRTVRHTPGEQLAAVQAALSRFLLPSEPWHGSDPERLANLFEKLGLQRFETFQHSLRVAAYSLLIGRLIGLDQVSLDEIEVGALLHDIGKVGVPRNVLLSNRRLTPEERSLLEMHPQIGWNLLADLPGSKQSALLVYSHHERFDGKGYPRCLKGESIPLGARIFAVADTVDAITADRSYRRGLPIERARAEIDRMCSMQFDPLIVEHFRRIPDEDIRTIRSRFADGVERHQEEFPDPCEP